MAELDWKVFHKNLKFLRKHKKENGQMKYRTAKSFAVALGVPLATYTIRLTSGEPGCPKLRYCWILPLFWESRWTCCLTKNAGTLRIFWEQAAAACQEKPRPRPSPSVQPPSAFPAKIFSSKADGTENCCCRYMESRNRGENILTYYPKNRGEISLQVLNFPLIVC